MSASSALSTRHRVLSAYRRLYRAQQVAFANDVFMQREARKEMRQQFAARRHDTDGPQLEAAITAATEAADYLRTSVIQAKRVAPGQLSQTRRQRPLLPSRHFSHHSSHLRLLCVVPVAEASIRPEQTVKDPFAKSAAQQSSLTLQTSRPHLLISAAVLVPCRPSQTLTALCCSAVIDRDVSVSTRSVTACVLLAVTVRGCCC